MKRVFNFKQKYAPPAGGVGMLDFGFSSEGAREVSRISPADYGSGLLPGYAACSNRIFRILVSGVPRNPPAPI